MVSSIGEPNYPREKQHLNVVEAANKCNVKLIVYSSFNYQKNTNIISTDHKYTEKIIEESGLNYSIARNATYIDSEGELFKNIWWKKKIIHFIIHVEIKKLHSN